MIPGSHLGGGRHAQPRILKNQELGNINRVDIDAALVNSLSVAPQGEAVGVPLDVSGYEYHLGIGDVLSIGVWDHPELTIPAAVQRTRDFDGFRVQSDGTITFAYAPRLPAAGKTVSQLREELIVKLSEIIENPQVDIKVVGYNSQKVYVTGEIRSPGVYPVSDVPLTLVDALNQAGGLTEKADWREVTFTRGGVSEKIEIDRFYSGGDLSQNRLLQHGDLIHVSRTDKQKVFVLGDVVNAGIVEINRYGLSLAEALSAAGGLNEKTADANGVFVLRRRDPVSEGIVADVYQLHAKNAVALVLASRFELEPQDIVYVTSAPVSRWNRVISQLIPLTDGVENVSQVKADGALF